MFLSASRLAGVSRTAGDPLFSQVGMLLYGRGINGSTIITDATGKGVTRTGNPTISTSTPAPGTTSSMSFNGSSYLTLPTSDDFRPGLGDYTMEAYVYQTARSGVCDFLSFCNVSSSTGVFFQITGTGFLALSTYVSQFLGASTGALNLNQWYHVAACRSAGTTRLFVDGVVVATLASDTTNITDGSCAVGAINNGAGPYTGLISNARWTKAARYTGAFIPPALPLQGPALTDPSFLSVYSLMHFDGANGATTTTDVKNNAVTMSSCTLTTSQFKFGASSLSVTSAASRTTFAGPALGTGDFTMEGWVRFTTFAGAGSFNTIMDARPGADGAYLQLAYDPVGFSGNLGWVMKVSGTNRIIGGAHNASLNTWYHVAISRVAGSTRLFINGVQVGSTYADSTSYIASTWNLGNASANGYQLQGQMDDFRLTVGVGRYSANFTPPTDPFPNC